MAARRRRYRNRRGRARAGGEETFSLHIEGQRLRQRGPAPSPRSARRVHPLQPFGPKIIVTLGKFAAQTLLRDPTAISKLRGRWREYEGVKLMPTFHPAYLLRSPEEKGKAWDDLKLVMKEFGKAPKK